MPYLSPTEILGYIAGLISALSFLPQVLTVFNGHSTKGISLGMYMLYLLSLFLWAVYAYLIDAHALLATEVVTGVLVGYILLKILSKN